jgi:hypothetical protein
VLMLDRGPTPLYYQHKTLLESEILSQEVNENELTTSGGWQFARPLRS